MTVASMALVNGDHGLSEEARTLREALRSPSATPAGASFDRRLWELQEAVDEASLPNWDGYGATPVTREAFEAAIAFSQALPTTWPSPEIAADPDGEITFEWSRGPQMVFAVSFGGGDLVSYAGLFGRSKTRGTEILVDPVPKVVMDNLVRLFPNKLRLSA